MRCLLKNIRASVSVCLCLSVCLSVCHAKCVPPIIRPIGHTLHPIHPHHALCSNRSWARVGYCFQYIPTSQNSGGGVEGGGGGSDDVIGVTSSKIFTSQKSSKWRFFYGILPHRKNILQFEEFFKIWRIFFHTGILHYNFKNWKYSVKLHRKNNLQFEEFFKIWRQGFTL